jgi:hypothetical protein
MSFECLCCNKRVSLRKSDDRVFFCCTSCINAHVVSADIAFSASYRAARKESVKTDFNARTSLTALAAFKREWRPVLRRNYAEWKRGDARCVNDDDDEQEFDFDNRVDPKNNLTPEKQRIALQECKSAPCVGGYVPWKLRDELSGPPWWLKDELQ